LKANIEWCAVIVRRNVIFDDFVIGSRLDWKLLRKKTEVTVYVVGTTLATHAGGEPFYWYAAGKLGCQI
jgi:hypothetical protein